MRFGTIYFAAGLALSGMVAAPALSAPAVARSPTQSTDWTKRISTSSFGGYIVGNPAAKHNLVEYVSYTCSHCADFEVKSSLALKREFIAKGDLNVEVRNYVRDPIDFTAAILARCGGPAKFFGNHQALMASQSIWLKAAVATPAEAQKGWYEGDFTLRLKKIANDVGFYPIMAKRGINKGQANQCLANGPTRDKLLAMTKYANETVKITGTPSFTVNGNLLDKVHDWPSLEPILTDLPKK